MPLRYRAGLAAVGALSLLISAGCTQSSGSTKAFCDQVAQVPSLETVLARFSEADPGELRTRIDKARSAYHALEDAAPSEIHDETADVVALVDDILDAVADNPDDPVKAADQLRKAMADHKGVAGSRTKVASYAERNCKVQLDPTLTGSTTSTTAVTSTTVPATTTTLPGG